MEETCKLGGCSNPAQARGLCSADYQHARATGILDEISPSPYTICEQCGNPIPAGHRWGSRFCSADCKQHADSARVQAARRRANAGRICDQCGQPITDRNGRARFCSRDCKQKWQNVTRQAAKRAAWLATKPACQRCGDPIPESRFRNSKYCSVQCKRLDAGDRWRASAPGYNRQYLYGISPEQYEAMTAAQGGVCAICGTAEWMGKDQRPHVDHDHVTGAFRGLLCMECNIGLGKFAHDPARLRAAADYLERALANVTV